jgi:hypothetical protein
MSVSLPSDPDTIRRIVDAWVAEQSDTLADRQRDTLDVEHPQWRQQAAQLIAEGLLAYVVVEMVAPDLAIAGSHADAGHDADPSEASELTARLGAHLRDFIDYRAELAERVDGGKIALKPPAAAER